MVVKRSIGGIFLYTIFRGLEQIKEGSVIKKSHDLAASYLCLQNAAAEFKVIDVGSPPLRAEISG